MLKLSKPEIELLEDIKELFRGEIFEVRDISAFPYRRVEMGEKAENFFRTLRQIRYFDKVTIVDGEPTYAEYRAKTSHGRDCLKKYYF